MTSHTGGSTWGRDAAIASLVLVVLALLPFAGDKGLVFLAGTLTLHVIIGLIALTVVALLQFRGEFRDGRHEGAVRAVGWYWHFVDGVWVVVFTAIYLAALVS